MSRHREPAFNIAEPAPVWFAGLLVVLFPLIMMTPLGRSETLGSLLVLRPIPYLEGTGWLSTIGHAFAHTSWSHVLLNSAFLVIFSVPTLRALRAKAVREGKGGQVTRPWQGIFFTAVAFGAVAQWLWWGLAGAVGLEDLSRVSAIGASGGVSGMFATAGYAMGGPDMMKRFGLAWVVLNAVIAVFGFAGESIAWAAHLGGFAGGMLMAPRLLQPGASR